MDDICIRLYCEFIRLVIVINVKHILSKQNSTEGGEYMFPYIVLKSLRLSLIL